MPTQKTTTLVELGSFHVSKAMTEVLAVNKIATGMALVAMEPQAHVGGIAYVALPDSAMAGNDSSHPDRYADLVIPKFLSELQALGAQKGQLNIKMVGGAQMFKFGGGGASFLNIGSRNAVAIRTALLKLGIHIEKSDTGGNKVRNVKLDIETGTLLVAELGQPEAIL